MEGASSLRISSDWVEAQIEGAFELNQKQRAYLRFHASRLSECLVQIMNLVQGIERPRVLDVAPHFSTMLIRRLLPPGSIVNSLGWLDEKTSGRCVNKHFAFDLNDVHYRDRWPQPEEHDVVLAGEIVEHLFTSADRFMSFIAGFLTPGGSLVLCTPNAASLRKRLQLAVGINPFEMINERRDGHVREYTVRELREACLAAGLAVEQVTFADYWPERGLLRMTERVVPRFRRGLMVVATRRRTSEAVVP